MISKTVYLYHKKHRYLESYVQDLVVYKTQFKPYKIKLEVSSKEFNHFIFKYDGIKYDLLEDKLSIIAE